MRPRTAFSLALALIAFALPALCAAAAPVHRVNAHELVRIAAGSCAGAAQALEKRADSQDPRYQPLRSVLKSMAGTVAEVGARLNARDLGFFKALRTGTRTLAEVHVLLARTGLQDPEIAGSLQSLDTAYGRLRNRYGQEWLRFRAGPPLGAAEKSRFEALRAMQALLAVKLVILQDKARAAGDVATAGELGRLAAQAKAISQAPPSLEELLNASVAGDAIQGEYAAIREANPTNPIDEPEWNDADQVVTDLSTDESVGFVFVTDLETVEQWSYTGERTNLTTPEEPEPDLAELTDPADPADPIDPIDPTEEECTAESAAEGCLAGDLLGELAPPVPPSPPAAPPAPATPPAPARPSRPLMHGFLL